MSLHAIMSVEAKAGRLDQMEEFLVGRWETVQVKMVHRLAEAEYSWEHGLARFRDLDEERARIVAAAERARAELEFQVGLVDEYRWIEVLFHPAGVVEESTKVR